MERMVWNKVANIGHGQVIQGLKKLKERKLKDIKHLGHIL